MKLYLIKFFTIILIFFSSSSFANNFKVKYTIKTSGIKIGELDWSLRIIEDKYISKIETKNSGILSSLYKFEGKYISTGIIVKKIFTTKKYEQYWKTKKKTRIVKISFNDYVTKIYQKPAEKELARINIKVLFQYYDPITSFLNILNEENNVKTIDGRRIYTMKKINLIDKKKISLKIDDYKNIWADHKRNDLKKIEFFVEEEMRLPKKIKIYLKNRIFNLQIN